MISVALGLATALLWGAAALLLASVADGTSPRVFAFRFLGVQALLVLPAAVAVAPTERWTLAGIGTVLLAAVFAAAAMLAYQRALQREAVAVVAPLVSIEGVVAAVIAVAAGEPLSIAGAVGLALAAAGALLVGLPRGARWVTAGSAYAILTAVLFGTTLWLISEVTLDTFATLVLLNGVAALLVFAGGPRTERRVRERAQSKPWVLPAAGALNVLGWLTFMLGARAESVAVTAVLAAQFGVVAAIGGFSHFGERLPPRRLLGVAVLTVGATVVAAASA